MSLLCTTLHLPQSSPHRMRFRTTTHNIVAAMEGDVAQCADGSDPFGWAPGNYPLDRTLGKLPKSKTAQETTFWVQGSYKNIARCAHTTTRNSLCQGPVSTSCFALPWFVLEYASRCRVQAKVADAGRLRPCTTGSDCISRCGWLSFVARGTTPPFVQVAQRLGIPDLFVQQPDGGSAPYCKFWCRKGHEKCFRGKMVKQVGDKEVPKKVGSMFSPATHSIGSTWCNTVQRFKGPLQHLYRRVGTVGP